MNRIFALAALLALTTSLAGCTFGTKYEASRVFDNNCSGNGWIHDDAFCADFLANMPPPPPPQS
jgi:hypothetical protein